MRKPDDPGLSISNIDLSSSICYVYILCLESFGSGAMSSKFYKSVTLFEVLLFLYVTCRGQAVQTSNRCKRTAGICWTEPSDRLPLLLSACGLLKRKQCLMKLSAVNRHHGCYRCIVQRFADIRRHCGKGYCIFCRMVRGVTPLCNVTGPAPVSNSFCSYLRNIARTAFPNLHMT